MASQLVIEVTRIVFCWKVFRNQVSLWKNVQVDDLTAKLAIIASNDQQQNATSNEECTGYLCHSSLILSFLI